MATRATKRRGAPTPTPARAKRTGVLLWAAIIACTAFAVYWNSLAIPFLFDDEPAILNNLQIRDLTAVANVLSPPRSTPVAGRPLVNLSFAVNHALGGFDVGGYHVLNISIHVLAALVLFGIVRRTLNLPIFSDRLGSRSTALAGACALIWMLHPLQTEAVDYLAARSESMMGLFLLLTLYSSIRAAASSSGVRWQVAAVLACALGMACKESMVVAPVLVVLYDRCLVFPSMKNAARKRWPLYAGLAATWLELAWLMSSGPRSASVGLSLGTSPWTYLLNQTVMIVQYLRLTIWPHGFVVDYGLPEALTLQDVTVAALFVTCLLAGAVALLIFRPRVGFLAAWFFVTLAPASSVIPIVTEVGAERRMYLPLAAIVVLGVLGVDWIIERLAATRSSVTPRALKTIVLTCVCVALAAGTVLRNREYVSRLSIARTSVDRWPHGRARFTLATELLDTGDRVEAMAQLRESARDYPGARYALGTELISTGKIDEGIEQLQQFVTRMPTHINVIPARELMGRALMSQGKFDLASSQFDQLLAVAPRYADAHGYLGDISLARRQVPEAIAHYQELLKIRPNSPRALGGLGIALASANRVDEAITTFERAIDADPEHVDARLNLARALLTKAEYAAAGVQAQQVLRLKPDDAVAHDLLGVALVSQHDLDGAIQHFQLALKGRPDDREAQQHLALASQMKANQARGR